MQGLLGLGSFLLALGIFARRLESSFPQEVAEHSQLSTRAETPVSTMWASRSKRERTNMNTKRIQGLNRMSTVLDGEVAQCVTCEKAIAGDDWFARVKHGEWTVMLCSERCAKAFYAQRLPGLRRLALLAAHPLLRWPRAIIGSEKYAATL
jgi:hypothetical protein